MMSELNALTMHEARVALHDGTLLPGDIHSSTMGTIERLNPHLGAFSWLAANQEEPSFSDHPLSGFSLGLKANICAEGMRTDCGSQLLANYYSSYDSTVVSRLRQVGAHFCGTTAMDEFGMGSSCEYSTWGPVSNPWISDRIPGGSSGGSAAAVASGMVWYALGTDTGGSVRYPAHCCGLVGLKPTYGRISRHGLVAFASSLDTIGIIARDTADAALVFSTLAGHDPLDATSLVADVEPYSDSLISVKGMKVGVPWDLLETDLQGDVLADFKISLQHLKADGVDIVDITLPAARDSVSIYTILSSAEAASNLARFDGTAFGVRRAGCQTYGAMVTETRTQGLGVEVKRRILMGTHVLSAGYRDHFYERACAARHLLQQQLADAYKKVQVIATPTAAACAFARGSRLHDPLAMYKTDQFTIPANLAGLPAITVPTMIGKHGLPLSIQFMGPALAENTLFALAGALEQQRQFRTLKEAPWHRHQR